ncbi:hypothetical protein P7C70_g6887, partial [Phenoliferia sp. Uapishka_3]
MEERSGDLGLGPRIQPRQLAVRRPTSSAPVTRAPSPAPSSGSLSPQSIAVQRSNSQGLGSSVTNGLVSKEAEDGVVRRMRRWLVAFAVVEFDLDLGPDLISLYPPTPLSPALQSNIAFSSLPEGDMPTAGAHTYSWTIPIPRTEVEDRDEGVAKDRLPDVDGNLYGFVYFVQEKNVLLRRGYSQRSLVLITHQPSLVGLFTNTLSILGPLYFKHGSETGGVLETACYNVAAWPDLVEGSTLDLPLLGSMQSVAIPLSGQPQWPLTSKPNHQPVIAASIPLTPLTTSFHASVLSFTKVLLLWELLLLGEPILVFSNDPRTGSELVHHLRNIIRPIVFSGDCRPYFHIHDHDFARIAAAGKVRLSHFLSVPSKFDSEYAQPPSGTLVASTNPLVLTTLKHWPHVLRATAGNKVDSKPAGLTTERKRHVKKDSAVAKAVDRAFSNGDYLECDALLFKHLATLTEQFLTPLNRYFGTLPSNSTYVTVLPTRARLPLTLCPLSSLSNPPLSRSFQPSSFLASLKAHGTPLLFRATNVSSAAGTTSERFYLRFLTSPNFASWLHRRSDAADGEVRRKYLDRLEKTELGGWIGGRGDDEVEELARRLESEAKLEEEAEEMTPSTSLDRNRSVLLRKQVERLRTLRDERSERSSTSGAESDSDVASFASGK